MGRLKTSFFSLILLACATPTKLLETEKTYRKTLKFSINGEKASGTFSAKKKPYYLIDIATPQKPNIVKVTSCHQEKIFLKPGKEIEFEYRPDSEIESGGLPCYLEISALEDSGKNQWGLVDFKLESENLEAKSHCNGEIIEAKGSYVCQSRVDLVQAIEFSAHVYAYAPEECNKIEPKDGTMFYFSISEGTCFYLFSDDNGSLFRLVTFGYNEALIDD